MGLEEAPAQQLEADAGAVGEQLCAGSAVQLQLQDMLKCGFAIAGKTEKPATRPCERRDVQRGLTGPRLTLVPT